MGIEDSSLKRTRPSAYLYRAAAAHVRAFAEGSLPEKAARSLFGTDVVTAEVLKAASGQATTITTGWAAELKRDLAQLHFEHECRQADLRRELDEVRAELEALKLAVRRRQLAEVELDRLRAIQQAWASGERDFATLQ